MNGFELVQIATLAVGAVMLCVVFGLHGVARLVMRLEAGQRDPFRRNFHRD